MICYAVNLHLSPSLSQALLSGSGTRKELQSKHRWTGRCLGLPGAGAFERARVHDCKDWGHQR
jgi:hypothetical protein